MFHLHFHLPYSAAGFFAGAALILATPVQADKIKHPIAVFSGLDKITGRTIAFQAATGETVQFGTLQITERACLTRPATEAPQTTSFVEVDEVDAAKKYKRIFSGWMFAASPGLHGIEHPIYDIWLTECTGGHEPPESGPAPDPAAVMPPPDMPDAPPAPVSKPPRTRDHGKHHATPPVEEPVEAPPPADDPIDAPAPQDGDTPPLDTPIEVGPPPGFHPVPPERLPAQLN
ncbi:MAG TPA: DUF2155 domain-containing protein [Methylocella sp.]